MPSAHHAWVAVAALIAVTVTAGVAVIVDRSHSSSSSTNRGSGVAATETRPVAAFTSVELAGSSNVAVHVGGRRSVVVHADDNLLKDVSTSVLGGRLVVRTTGTFTTDTPMSVVVTVPSLTAVTLSGSGNVTVDGVDAPTFAVSLPGSGNIQATGTTQRLDASLDGSGNEWLTGLQAHDARAVVSGSGNIFTTATGTLDAHVSGSGTVVYAGSPLVTQQVTGSGAVVGG